MLAALLSVLKLAIAALGAQPVASEPPAAAQPASIATVDDLLLALEDAGADLQTLQSTVMYTNILGLEGDSQTRTGDLYFIARDGAQGLSRRFAVHWNSLRVDERLDRDYRQSVIFDGEWLVERNDVKKQFIKRQVVKPGEKFDPLRIGEGPFPIPIGQSRDDILERFVADMPAVEAGLDDDQLLAVVRSKPTYQLHLTPRPEFERDMKLADIRIWYRADTLLPVLAQTESFEGNQSVVLLMNVRTNEELDLSKLDTTTPDRGWNVEVTTYTEDPQ